MIGYVTLGTRDLQKAAQFYDALLAELGGKRMMEMGEFVAWGTDPAKPMLDVIKPYDGKEATVGNGVMVGIPADSPETVNRVYEKAIALGAADEGAAGPRGDSFYAGYFRDMDGNKLAVFCIPQAS